jgi:hypothetical protein
MGLWAHLLNFIALALFLTAYLTFLDTNDTKVIYSFSNIIWGVLKNLPGLFAFFCILGLASLVFTKSRKSAVKRAFRWLAELEWIEIVFLRVPVAFLYMSTINHILLSFKINIANFAPYSWDLFFAETDRLLFLGIDPWVLTHRIFEGLEATLFLDNLYLIWFLVLYLCAFSIALLPMRHPTRLTFLLAYGLNWIVGGVFLAIALPAVGPVYMEWITGDPTFVPLMELLYQYSSVTEIRALGIQETLWDGFTTPNVDPLGISAFPSLHVEMAATCACLGFAVNRALGWLLTVFTAGILVGSVHLGWHYAIDGIAGIALAVLFWGISARITRWWLDRTEPGGIQAGAPEAVVD